MLLGIQNLSEKQIKLQKSRIYKEMLDNQILLNRKYKRQMQMIKQKEQVSKQSQINIMPVHHEQRDKNSQSIIKEIMRSRLRKSVLKKSRNSKHSRYLPTIMDNNRLIQGQSKYITIEDGDDSHQHQRYRQLPKIIQKQRAYTDYFQDDDGYLSGCEQIIIDLQQLNKGIDAESQMKRKFRMNDRDNQYGKASRFRYKHNTSSYNDLQDYQEAKRFPESPIYKNNELQPNKYESYDPNQINSRRKIENPEAFKQGIANNSNRSASKMQYQSIKNKQDNQMQQQYSQLKKIMQKKEEVKLNKYGSEKIRTSKIVMMDKSRRDNFIKQLRNAKSRGENLYLKLNQRKSKQKLSK